MQNNDSSNKGARRWLSCARWAHKHGFKHDLTTDLHDSKAAAVAVCEMLMRDGLGGERCHYPLDTWAEEAPVVAERGVEQKPMPVVRISEWLGVDLIRAERERQIAAEGWGPEHDDAHTDGALAKAAASYALHAAGVGTSYGEQDPNKGYGTMRLKNGCLLWWPWLIEWWKPKDPVRDLVRAGALVAAEIDRLLRERSKTPNSVLNEQEGH